MSAAAAAAEEAPPPKGKKKLIIIIAVAVLVLAIGGAAALMLLKKKPPADEGDEEAEAPPAKTAKHDPKATPVFVPLDPFTVNLADREAERYAQVGITLEIVDPKTGDEIKKYMPAIRHGILMLLSDKTAAMLADREGKLKLASEIRRETSRVLGAELPDEEEGDAHAEEAPRKKAGKDEADDEGGKKKKKARKKAPPELPVRAVQFSNFIIQ